jgi:ribose transport system permease protein
MPGDHAIRRVLAHSLMRALLALALVVIIGAIFNADGTFFKWGTHRDMLRQASVFGILACGMTVVIITGGIDLSVGSVLALSAVVFAKLSIHEGLPAWAAIGGAVFAGIGCGVVSGAACARFSLQPFIVTLALMVFARGLAKTVSGGMKVSTMVQQPDGSYEYVPEPAIFSGIDSRVLDGNVSVVTIVMLLCMLVTGIILISSRAGRHIYAIGGNEEAARLSGVPVARTKLLAYALSGMFAGIAGVCQAAQDYQGDPEAGTAYELSAIAIVVIGGTHLMGGRGGILLTLVGVLTIGYLEKILSINAVGEATRLMLTGGIILGAVLLQRGRSR